MAQYELISFVFCPFVQKTLVALEERSIDYDITYIDLGDKPDWFRAISPMGKVPLLKVEGAVLFESTVINEYLEETAPGAGLHPADPIKRAHNRAWIEFLSALNNDVHRLMMAPDSAEAGAHAQIVRKKLARLELVLGDGPFFNGEAFSLVDCGAAPALQRIGWINAIAPVLVLFGETPKVAAWAEALMARPSVQRSTVADIHPRFLEYLKGKGMPSRDRSPSWLGRIVADQ